MLNWCEYTEAFSSIQNVIVPLTEELARWIKPGMTERQVANEFERRLADVGLKNHWYPILVCAGAWSGKPLTRRVHLPSDDVVIRPNDIIILDSTPLVQTVWGNWSKGFPIGDDPFFGELCKAGSAVAASTLHFAVQSAKTVGEIFDFCMERIREAGLSLLDSRADVGHSIFQVPVGQTVEKTPESDRLFISEEHRNAELRGLLSIEPQVGRVNPVDGIMYGVKQQRVVVYNNSLDSNKTTSVVLPNQF